MSKKRPYKESFLNFGFSFLIKNGIQIPQCEICFKTLTNESMILSKFREHFVKVHPELVDNGVEYLKLKTEELKRANLMHVERSDRSRISLWSYLITPHWGLQRTKDPILSEKTHQTLPPVNCASRIECRELQQRFCVGK